MTFAFRCGDHVCPLFGGGNDLGFKDLELRRHDGRVIMRVKKA